MSKKAKSANKKVNSQGGERWRGRPIPKDIQVEEPNLRDLPRTIWNLPRLAFLSLIRGYQATFSKTLPLNTCRFYPSCSHYGYMAIYKYGILKGSLMAAWRIIRCNPLNPGGFDPVP